jgi:hypothetical protein
MLLHNIQPSGSSRPRIDLLDVTSGRSVTLLEHASYALHTARFSPDERWLCFHAATGVVNRRVYVAPFRGPQRIEEKDWIPVTDGSALDREPCWSPEGSLIYFLSERDAFRCVWAQRLAPATKQPIGEPFPVYHSHAARRSLIQVGDTGRTGFFVVPGRMVFTLNELSGNIWVMELQR